MLSNHNIVPIGTAVLTNYNILSKHDLSNFINVSLQQSYFLLINKLSTYIK